MIEQGLALETGVAASGRLDTVKAGLVGRRSGRVNKTRALLVLVLVGLGVGVVGGDEALSAGPSLLACAVTLFLDGTTLATGQGNGVGGSGGGRCRRRVGTRYGGGGSSVRDIRSTSVGGGH